MSRRAKVALLATVLWLGGGGLLMYLHRPEFVAMSPNEWGDFLAGFLAPLAFLWLIIGYFQQGEELRLNTEALHLQQKELRKQVEETATLARAASEQAKIAERRLTLEHRRRKVAEAERKERIQPDFVSHGGTGQGGVWKMKVRNEGGGAAHLLYVSLNGERLRDEPINYIAKGEQFSLVIPKEQHPGRLRFKYMDQEGEDQEKEYWYRGQASFRPIGPNKDGSDDNDGETD